MIRIEFIYPPIPVRSFDWLAIDDATGLQAYGATEAEARENLLEIMEDSD